MKIEVPVIVFLRKVNGLIPLLLLLVGCIPSANLKKYESYRLADQSSSAIPEGKVKVTFLGVSTLLIDDGETQLLTDGFFTRPKMLKAAFGKVAPDTLAINAVLDKVKMDKLKAIFTAHSHYDHVMDAPFVVQKTGAKLYGSKTTLMVGRGAGLEDSQMELYQPDKVLEFGKFRVTILKSRHTPPFKVMGKIVDDSNQELEKPLSQPAKLDEFKEGGAFDMLIEHNGHSMLIKASSNYIEGAWDNINADVVFLGLVKLDEQSEDFRQAFYQETIGAVKPNLIVPIHWDNFMKPLNGKLKPIPTFGSNVKEDFDFIIQKSNKDSIQFGIMQGYESVILF